MIQDYTDMHLRATESTTLSQKSHVCLAAARCVSQAQYYLPLWIALPTLLKISFGLQKFPRDSLRVIPTRRFMTGVAMQLERPIVAARSAARWLYLRVWVSLEGLWMSNFWSRTVEWAASNTKSATVYCVVESFVPLLLAGS